MNNKEINLYEKFIKIIDKYYKLIFWLILALAIFLNCYRLGDVPHGINIDEAGMTYDAYSIANYGVDRYLKQFPVYFINFGGGQSALYTYLTAITIKIVGFYNNTIIRIPALILSILEVIISYFLVKEYRGKKQGLLFMFLVTIMPWHIMKSRWALDCYLLSPMLLFSIYSLLKAVKGKKLWQYFISGLIFGLTLYTYILSYIVIPIFLIITLIYLIRKKKIKINQVIVFIIPLVILAIPLILMIMVQNGWINEINSFITIPKMYINRTNEIDISNILGNLASLINVFIEPLIDYNGISGFGPLYPIGLILMFLGLIFTAITMNKKEKQNDDINLSIIMLFIFISNFILNFLTSQNINKANGIYISATYFILVAFIQLKEKSKIIFTILLTSLSMTFILFTKEYFTTFAESNLTLFDNGDIDVLEYVYSTDLKDRKLCTDISYIYNLYVNPISPYEFYKDIVTVHTSDVFEVMGYGNYIRHINLSNIDDNAVYITYNQNKATAIEEMGFTKEKYKHYYILYKNINGEKNE